RVRRKEKLHALDVSGRRAEVVESVKGTTGDPFCAGRHSNLVASAVVADRSSYGKAPVARVIARHWRVVTARVAYAVMDSVMPVVIVVGRCAVPPAIVRFKRIVRPANTAVSAPNNDSLPGKTQCPDIGRVRVIDARFNGLGCLRPRRRFSYRN